MKEIYFILLISIFVTGCSNNIYSEQNTAEQDILNVEEKVDVKETEDLVNIEDTNILKGSESEEEIIQQAENLTKTPVVQTEILDDEEEIIDVVEKSSVFCQIEYSLEITGTECNIKYGSKSSKCNLVGINAGYYECESDPILMIEKPSPDERYDSVLGLIGDFTNIDCESILTEYDGSRYLVKCVNPIECQDSDNGKEYYTQGYITFLGNSNYDGGSIKDTDRTRNDYCIDNTLIEFFCMSSKRHMTLSYNCINGCVNGACQGSENCIDKGNQIPSSTNFECCSGLNEVEIIKEIDGRKIKEIFCD